MERMVFMHNRLTLGYMTDKALKSVSHEDANALTHINLAFGVIRDGLLDMSRLPNTPQRQAPTSARNTMPKTMLFTP